MPGRVKCFVSGCSNSWYNKDNDNVSFHRLPKKLSLIKQYEEHLKTKLPKVQNARICGEHFKNGRREFPTWPEITDMIYSTSFVICISR